MKSRGKTRRRSGPLMPAARGPFDLGGVPLAGATHPPGSRRRGGGRLGRALKAAVGKAPAAAGKQQVAAKALARWENEGGRVAPRAASVPAGKVESTGAPKKSAAKRPPQKVKPKPGTSVAKKRR
jgi:hypothetical protein